MRGVDDITLSHIRRLVREKSGKHYSILVPMIICKPKIEYLFWIRKLKKILIHFCRYVLYIVFRIQTSKAFNILITAS